MRLSIIVAQGENRVIGRQGDLPWRLSADLRRFKRLTMGHHLVMGRRTWQSIGRPLPGRTTVVLSSQADFRPQGAAVARDLDEAIRLATGDEEVFVVGGQQVYEAALHRADRLYLTTVHAEVEGDRYFPPLDPRHWKLISEERHPADGRNEFDYTFAVYDRA